ncbi:MAG: hypothetical protein COV48_16400, partial [Elusimicrobia bacterium CG11_big_fil_rev_8_21_14_0_20_64_6]
MKKILENKMNPISRLIRLFVAMLLAAGYVPSVSAQTMGATLIGFNVLANTAVSLTGTGVAPVSVAVGGSAPFIARALTDATITTDHLNDATAVTGQTEALALYNSLTAPAGATFIAMG